MSWGVLKDTSPKGRDFILKSSYPIYFHKTHNTDNNDFLLEISDDPSIKNKSFGITRNDNSSITFENFDNNNLSVNNIVIPINTSYVIGKGDKIQIDVGVEYILKLTKEYLELPNELHKKYVIGNEVGLEDYGTIYRLFERTTLKILQLKKKFTYHQYLNESDLKSGKEKILALNHEHVMKIYDIYIESIENSGTNIFIIMEFMEFGCLYQYIDMFETDEEWFKSVFYKVCLGLQYLHSKNIVHEYLVPNNIFLSSSEKDADIKIYYDDVMKEAGFKECDSYSRSNYFVAPEVFKKSTDEPLDKSADVWNLGVLLHCMLSKSFPEPLANLKFNFGWSNISDEAKDLIKKILIIKIEERYTLDDILKHPWLNDQHQK